MQKGTVKSFFFRTLCGFFLGVSVVAPGVSGSVMAVMMGIYRDLIHIISNPFKKFKKNFIYLLPMGIGAVLSFVLFIKVFAFLFDSYPVQSRVLFMGLIAGGLPSMFKQANKGAFKLRYLAGILGAFAVAGTAGILARGGTVNLSDINTGYLCIAGFISGVSSMVPGMSVSMVLMLLGVYDYLLGVASGFASDIVHTASIVIPVGICFLAGMVLFSKLTKIIFERYSKLAYFMVFGFMCGTLTAIFPDTAPRTFMGWIGCVLMFFAGLFISVMFQFLGNKFRVSEAEAELQKEKKLQI